MRIEKFNGDRREFLPLLLIGDESEAMIGKYIDEGTMYLLHDEDVRGVCIVTDEGDGILEIKNIAVLPEYHRRGYGRAFIDFISSEYRGKFSILQAGTGDSPLTVPFYERCGFVRHHVIPGFFTINYDPPIVEGGVLLCDMVYFRKYI